MLMTVKQCRDIAMQHINQYSIAGQTVPLSYNNQADYQNKIINLINDAQMEIAKTTKRIPAQFKIVQSAIPSLVKITETKSKIDKDETTNYSGKGFAKSYYFEISGTGTVYVESKAEDKDEWTVIKTITTEPAAEGGFNVYRGHIEPTERVRLRFSGESPYLFRNVGIYACGFPDDSLIPPCVDMFSYDLPDDLYQIDGRGIPRATLGTGELKYRKDYMWVGEKTLLLRSDLVGEFVVDYFRFPIRLDNNIDDENTYLDNTPDTHEAIPYYVASMLCRHDNAYIADTLYNLFEVKLSRFAEGARSEATMIEDVYGFDSMFGGVP